MSMMYSEVIVWVKTDFVFLYSFFFVFGEHRAACCNTVLYKVLLFVSSILNYFVFLHS